MRPAESAVTEKTLPLNNLPPARACAATQAASIAGSSATGTATLPGSNSTTISGATGTAR